MTLEKEALCALSCLDLTALNDDDTPESIRALTARSVTAKGHVAALCIYPPFIPVVRKALDTMKAPQEINIATVVNFPHGTSSVEATVAEIHQAVADGADEIDVVFPYQAFLTGDEAIGARLVKASKDALSQQQRLKVIIESGILQQEGLIKKASLIALENGADFIKTSTGKVSINATLEAAGVMLKAIEEYGDHTVGFKAAGGVKTVEEAVSYMQLAARICGEQFVTPARFRFGASSLLDNLLYTLDLQDKKENTGQY